MVAMTRRMFGDSIQIVRTAHTGTEANLKVGRIYCLRDPTGIDRYVGKTDTSEDDRMNMHEKKLQHDPLASPLYRYAHENTGGTFAEWTIRPLMIVHYDPAVNPDALVDAEDKCMKLMRKRGCDLLNKNHAKCQNVDRREYMRQWRARNPAYMSRKGKEHYLRRKAAAALAAME